jgi:hypothetical protein
VVVPYIGPQHLSVDHPSTDHIGMIPLENSLDVTQRHYVVSDDVRAHPDFQRNLDKNGIQFTWVKVRIGEHNRRIAHMDSLRKQYKKDCKKKKKRLQGQNFYERREDTGRTRFYTGVATRGPALPTAALPSANINPLRSGTVTQTGPVTGLGPTGTTIAIPVFHNGNWYSHVQTPGAGSSRTTGMTGATGAPPGATAAPPGATGVPPGATGAPPGATGASGSRRPTPAEKGKTQVGSASNKRKR